MKIFAPDSPFMRTMSRLFDLMVLNFIFLISCIPVFTIGAALTAMYTVVFRIGTDKESGVIGSYFRAFKENFKQSTQVFLILLLCGACVFFDTALFYQFSGVLRFLAVPCAILSLVVVFVGSYAFPLLSQFNNGNRQTLKNALIFSLAYLPKSILMGAVNVFPFVVLALNWLMFFHASFLWIFGYFSAIAYLNSLLMKNVFKPYLEEEEV